MRHGRKSRSVLFDGYKRHWRIRNAGGRLARDQFTIDFAAGQPTCPAGTAMPSRPGKTVRSY